MRVTIEEVGAKKSRSPAVALGRHFFRKLAKRD